MKATVLTAMPFLIPVGTKVRLTRPEDGFIVEGFFAGYKTYGIGILQDHFDFFPLFKKAGRDGSMSNRNIDFAGGTVGFCDLKGFDLEILELSLGFHNLDPSKYDDLACGGVAVCTAEMLAIAKAHGITKVDFRDYPSVDQPFATFNVDDDVTGDTLDAHLAVESLEFNDGEIVVRSEDERFCASLDGRYGEYFNVAEALPHIYHAFVEVINIIDNNNQ